MHIIGIQIEENRCPEVLKNLKPGWYPFGNYEIPSKDNAYQWRVGSEYSDILYQPNKDSPQINISCIVGKNGSGKTTLLDIMYRILNDFIYSVKNRNHPNTDEIEFAKVMEAKLYFELDAKLFYIHVRNHKVHLCILQEKRFMNVSIKKSDSILSKLFYTIGVNYSLYSMGFNEPGVKCENSWLASLYDHEYGYEIPLILTPHRTKGEIDIKYERTKAEYIAITLFLLLYSQGKSFLEGYKPIAIEYKYNKHYKQEGKDKIDYLAVKWHIFKHFDLIVSHFRKAWKKQLKTPKECNQKNVLNSLAYESFRICMTYKSYGRLLHIDEISNSSEASEIIKKIDFRTIVNKLEYDTSSVNLVIRQILSYVSRGKNIGEIVNISIDEFINRNAPKEGGFKTFDDVYTLLPPPFYDVSIYISKGKERITIQDLSSGEKQIIYVFSSLLQYIYNIANEQTEQKYKNINLIFDEVELYTHPEYQRTFLANLLDMITGFQITKDKISSINIIIATHSPFILSDVPIENILYLENGKPKKLDSEHQTYCANIYELLKNSFFLDYPMGDMAKRRIDEIIDAYESKDITKRNQIKNNEGLYRYITKITAELYIRNTISVMLDEIINNS